VFYKPETISQSNNDCASTPVACIQGAAAAAGASSSTRAGWTVGGGLESMFGQHWSAKVEYMYYDLGSMTFGDCALVTGNGTFPGAGGPAVVTSQSTTHFNGNIVRVGANYHF
jgi:outer membrane immunogenic protein